MASRLACRVSSTAHVALAVYLLGACGNDSPTPSTSHPDAGSPDGTGTGTGTGTSTGGNAVTSDSGPGGTVTSGGVGGTATNTGTGGSAEGGAAGAGRGDENASSGGGSGGSGGGGEDADTTPCTRVGWTCDSNSAVYCAEADDCSEGEDPCWVATRADCGSDSCILTGDDAACAQDGVGDSCAGALPVSTDLVISGESFSADFSDQLTPGGLNCVAGAASAPEALFDVQLGAGESVLISEVAELRDDEDDDVDVAFSVMYGCSSSDACPLSGGTDDAAGILYTADAEQVVTLAASAVDRAEGDYEIHIEFPTNLGTLGIGEHPPDVEGDPLAAGEWQSFVVHTTETLILAGTLSGNQGEDLDLLMFDEQGLLWMASVLEGDEHFATLVGAGSYHLLARAFEASAGFTLDLFTSDYDYRGQLGVGDSLTVDDGGAVTEGESYFVIIETLNDALVTGSVTADGGEPDIWLYDTLGPIAGYLDDGASQSFEETLPANIYIVELEARAGSGDIDDFVLELTLATPE